jgi:hypothetical protein
MTCGSLLAESCAQNCVAVPKTAWLWTGYRLL